MMLFLSVDDVASHADLYFCLSAHPSAHFFFR